MNDNYIMINNKKVPLTTEQVEEIKKSFKIDSFVPLSSIEVGEIAKIGEFEFIVLEHAADTTKVLLKDFWKTSKFDDDTNDYSESSIRTDLDTNFYREFADMVGKENIVSHIVDLTADDGRLDYGTASVFKVSLLTCDQYRKYVYILDKYRPGDLWWLATALSTKANGFSRSIRCASHNGTLDYLSCSYDDGGGVRPFCILKSDISVSKGE